MTTEIIIDGSEGEGGGQVLRTTLSLSAITGKPVRIQNVRGQRRKPGLLRQHLTAFRAAAEITGATMEGAELGSSEIAFHPGSIRGGEYEFSIGSAGSTTLVAQTLLPILSHAVGPSTVTITGGTHNAWAPTFDFLDQAFLPQYRSMGGRASAQIESYGFHPAGGGKLRLNVKPTATPEPLALTTRGTRLDTRVVALVSNLKRNIAEREVKTLLRGLNLAPEAGDVAHVDSPGPGNSISLFLEFEHVTEVLIGLGAHGVRAESVAKSVAADAKAYLTAEAAPATGEHLADQLLLPMALGAGGVFTTTDLTQHTRTNIDIIQRFLDVQVELTRIGRKTWRVEVRV